MIARDGGGDLPAVAARYHLYAARACPFSHRTLLVHRLKGLEQVVGVSFLDPYRDARGWCFSGGRYVDRANGFEFLSDAYDRADPAYTARVAVPVLWDTEEQTIVSGDSADIVRMFGSAFDEVGGRVLDLRPAALRHEIDRLNARIDDDVSYGVYRAGFATEPETYGEVFHRLFAAMDWLEDLLSRQRYLTGPRPTEADWRLFPTLTRFDAVYYVLFRCNGRRLVDYPNLWAYTRDLYQQPGVAETVAMDEIKRHYYTTLDMLNPSRIIPCGPLDTDFTAPSGRG